MHLTKHAKKRMQQRGLSDLTLKIIEENAKFLPCPGGGTKIIFGKKEQQRLLQELKKVLQALDKAKGWIIITKNNSILTMYKNN